MYRRFTITTPHCFSIFIERAKLTQIYEVLTEERDQESSKDQHSEVEDKSIKFVDSCCSSVEIKSFHFNISDSMKRLWARRLNVAERKRNALSSHTKNVLVWKWTMLNILKEISY